MHDFQVRFGMVEWDYQIMNWKKSSHASDVMGNVTSIFLIGCVVGALVVSWLADLLGRKRSIILGGAFFAVGGTFQAAASGQTIFFVGRFVSGIGIGILSMVVPIYISETAPTHIRGRMVTIQQLMITIGILVASIVNSLFFIFSSGEAQWRLALAMQVIPGALLFLIMLFMPFSPRWLVNQGRDGEAITVLSKLRALQPNAAFVQAEYNDIKTGIAIERQIGSANWSELLKKGLFNRVIIVVLLQAFQQLTGINVILYYAGDLFGKMGFGDTNGSITFVIINSFINFIATFPGMYFIERVGRKKLLIYGGFGMGISHFLVCIFTSLAVNTPIFAWFSVISVCMLFNCLTFRYLYPLLCVNMGSDCLVLSS
jgi:sugar porter (SP) family MFS transporter